MASGATENGQHQTSLHRNPFWVLRVTTRDDRRQIAKRSEECALLSDHENCQKARNDLTNPRNRLSVEMSWLPGVSPRKAEQLAQNLLNNPMSIREETGLPELARANLMAAAFEVLNEDEDTESVAEFIRNFALVAEEMDPEAILRDINEDRAVSGFPEIHETATIEVELVERRRVFKNAIKGALHNLPTTKLIKVMTDAVDVATIGGEDQGPALLDELVDSYEVETYEFLEKEHENISTLVGRAREVSTKGRHVVRPILDKIEEVARNWVWVVRPIQLSMKSRGIVHKPSNMIAHELRSLGIDLFNEHDMLDEADRITELLKELFAELPEVAETLEEDSKAINGIRQKAKEVAQRRKQWEQEITYQAEIGVMFKDLLRISPGGVEWKGTCYSLDSITYVRWGAIRTSVNGIPTGTDYRIAFGDINSGTVVSLKNEAIYSEFIQRLWMAVGARLMTEVLETLRGDHKITFGDIVVEDTAVTVTKHKFFGSNERVRLGWEKVKVWSADGSFIIGSSEDSKIYSQASYIEVCNTHIIEQIIRSSFKKGANKLSDLNKV